MPFEICEGIKDICKGLADRTRRPGNLGIWVSSSGADGVCPAASQMVQMSVLGTLNL